jgi:hypothetical protein
MAPVLHGVVHNPLAGLPPSKAPEVAVKQVRPSSQSELS